MCSRKSVGLRMEPWETPALTGYSCEDFPSRTTRSCLLLRKEEIRPNIWHEIPYPPWQKGSGLTGYSCEDFPSRTTRSCLTKKRRNKTKYLTWNSIRLKLRRRPACQTPSKALEKCFSLSSPGAVKSCSNSIKYNIARRSAVDREDLKSWWKSETRSHFSWWSTTLLFTSYSETTDNGKKTNRVVVFSCIPFTNSQ